MQIWRSLIIALVAVALIGGGAGCAKVTTATGETKVLTAAEKRAKAVQAFGESLDAAGRMFVDVGKVYNAQLDSGAITAAQYKPWADVAVEFKKSYPLAVAAWKAAKDANSIDSMEKVQTEIGPLLARVAAMGLTIYQLTAKPAPAPK